MAVHNLNQEMANVLTKLQQEAAALEKEEATTKSRVDALHEHLFKAQKKLFETQARIRELDMHLDAFKHLQESQNELLESMEKMRRSVKLNCENRLKTLEGVRVQMKNVKELSFAPQVYAELIESLRICINDAGKIGNVGADVGERPGNDWMEGTTLDDEVKNTREKLEQCLNEINELKADTNLLDSELKKIHLAGTSVDDMKAVLRSIRSKTLKLNSTVIECRLKRHRLEANGLVGNLD